MIKLKTKKEIDILREGGQHLAEIVETLSHAVKPGLAVSALDELARQEVKRRGGESAFLNYTPEGASRPFPAAVCVSGNEEIVHGIPNESDRILVEGDIVTIDMGLRYKGLITDHAITVSVGSVAPKIQKLLNATKEALQNGIAAATIGNTIGDIGLAVSSVAKREGFYLSKHLSGHGVGYSVHEDPFVLNEGKAGKGVRLEEGLVIAIEPMLAVGTGNVEFDDVDGYTVRTRDGSLAAHEEHTIAITKDGPLILTAL